MGQTYFSEREQKLISGLANSGLEIEQLEAENARRSQFGTKAGVFWLFGTWRKRA